MLDRAFELALQKLCTLPDEEYIDLLAALTVKAAQSGKEQVIFSRKDRSRVGKAVVTRANEMLAKQVAPKLPDEHADRIVSNTSTENTAANHGQTFPQPCRPPEQRGEQFSPGHIISPYCRERRSWPSRSSRRILRSRRR